MGKIVNNKAFPTKDLLKLSLEYDEFKNACADNVNYLTSIELLPVGDALKERIETAKAIFRKIRDGIGTDGLYGETAAAKMNDEMSDVKNAYIDLYFGEHKKRRLSAAEYKGKVALMDSAVFANLKRLSAIEEILPVSKLKALEGDLAALKICYEITPETLKSTHICPKCGFTLGGGDPLVKGAVDRIEERLDILTDEWTTTLLNTINDPLVFEQKQYLTAEQQKAVDGFVTGKKLPEKIDQFFITAVKALLEGFDAVTVNGAELMDILIALGACDADTFRRKIDEVVAGLSKGAAQHKNSPGANSTTSSCDVWARRGTESLFRKSVSLTWIRQRFAHSGTRQSRVNVCRSLIWN
ncbi:MAG: DUF6079 family protein [Gracilibacteraceae bacterium]|jgi:hypothetical protein|nr:DUF6079 family protein [Gracilibacteraceae bacterium]